MTNAEARFNKSLRPRKPEGLLERTARDVHLDYHTAPELGPRERCRDFMKEHLCVGVRGCGCQRQTDRHRQIDRMTARLQRERTRSSCTTE